MLHILPLPIIQHITHTFLSHIVPSIIPSYLQTKRASVNTQCISHRFALQPLPASDQWTRTYNDDSHTKVFLDRLSISSPLDKPIILHLAAPYRTTISRNLSGLLEGQIVYYESITTVTNHICYIFVPTSLRHIILKLMYATPVAGHMGG